MKLTITREDLRQFVLREANIDIGQTPIDIDIEGYKQMEGRYKWQETTGRELKEIICDKLAGKDEDSISKETIAKLALNSIYGIVNSDEDRKVITDKEGRVLDIVKEEEEPEKPKNKDMSANLKNHPDYTDYENTVLDFATSSEHKRQVPFFGAETIECCKARYQKMITKLNVKDSVKFSRIDSLPYLVKREGQESMNDVLNEGVNK
jgi:hypothetical protein